jgi:hypothetical protein
MHVHGPTIHGAERPFPDSLLRRIPRQRTAEIGSIDYVYRESSLPKILPSIAAALCVLGSLTSAAHGANINGQANYIYFKVPGGGDTCPTAINASMTTTGYYLVTYNEAHGFIRTADGTIDTFVVPGAVWTQPESINAAGDVTGFYELSTDPANYQVHGFLRYADGRIITVDPPPQGGNSYAGYPVSINDFDEVAGTLYTSAPSAYGFTRSRGVCMAPSSRSAIRP